MAQLNARARGARHLGFAAEAVAAIQAGKAAAALKVEEVVAPPGRLMPKGVQAVQAAALQGPTEEVVDWGEGEVALWLSMPMVYLEEWRKRHLWWLSGRWEQTQSTRVLPLRNLKQRRRKLSSVAFVWKIISQIDALCFMALSLLQLFVGWLVIV